MSEPANTPIRADQDLAMALEPDQMVEHTSRPVPRASLDKRVRIALWVLRVFAVLVTFMVIYAFVAQLQY